MKWNSKTDPPEAGKWVLVLGKQHSWIPDLDFGSKEVELEERYVSMGFVDKAGRWHTLETVGFKPDEVHVYMESFKGEEDLSQPLVEVLGWVPLPEP